MVLPNYLDYQTLETTQFSRDFIVLGSTHDHGSWDLTVNEETAKRIIEKNLPRTTGMIIH